MSGGWHRVLILVRRSAIVVVSFNHPIRGADKSRLSVDVLYDMVVSRSIKNGPPHWESPTSALCCWPVPTLLWFSAVIPPSPSVANSVAFRLVDELELG